MVETYVDIIPNWHSTRVLRTSPFIGAWMLSGESRESRGQEAAR